MMTTEHIPVILFGVMAACVTAILLDNPKHIMIVGIVFTILGLVGLLLK